ncbi:pyridine nucleotide-disulfide oxidoreductase [Cephaloticoccus primus]|uniref:Pyridine nucleotide-disulfide oxidoreductase n=1 Tax=Cephaloticoccus primus TaxID=1548207 RepID=A0A139SMF2_9BACT|nr:NAD(P)/FAD-dependent oxidoreductase [Cephaloticoccus primus]KXU35640.1 pyridine nucleotide-disulfide oxidoreductase [Cephaloticoccus primus]
MSAPTKHVVILGGGFAGINAARQLRQPNLRITLVDRQNHHLFQPLLYQVATAGLAAPDIAQPLRHILARQRNVTTLMDEVRAVDLEKRQVALEHSTLSYDYLVVALGARTGYFGRRAEWEPYAPGLKTLDEATQLRRRMLQAFEQAENARDTSEWSRLLSFVIIGGGPTGVETAGALVELARQVLTHDFRRIDPSKAHVHLVEAGPRLLPMFSPAQSEYTRRRLEKMGVKVHLAAPVTDIGPSHVQAGDLRIEASVILWAAGVEANPVTQTLAGVPLDRGGRVQVAPDLSLPGHPEVFAVGDLVAMTDARDVRVPGVAPAASQMGRHAARQILADLRSKPRQPFTYRDKGSIATIGRSAAVAQIAKLRFNGWWAWAMWMSVHLFFLIGLRNRVIIFLHWAWAYCTWQRGARIITGTQAPAAPVPPVATTQQS